MMKKAVYAGSFDPPTNGHTWMIQHGAEIFDRLVVAVGINPAKKGMFAIEERMEMLRGITKRQRNVTVTFFENQFLVNYARSTRAEYILRGIRGPKDYEYENDMKQVNEKIDSAIVTVFLIPPPALANISSSTVKEMVGPRGWESVVRDYVSHNVYLQLLRKMKETQKQQTKQGEERR
jgi:pantetheine-phosphate adenylyltransferase